MSIGKALLPELEHEYAGTRRALERVPSERFSWRPHPKSWTIAELATHLANMPSWMKITIDVDDLDLAGFDPAQNKAATSPAELLEKFDRNAAEAKAALAGASDERMLARWSLNNGPVRYFEMPRVAAIRSFVLNHNVHHRGQLTVYLRLLDVPVPGMYGPSADESM